MALCTFNPKLAAIIGRCGKRGTIAVARGLSGATFRSVIEIIRAGSAGWSDDEAANQSARACDN